MNGFYPYLHYRLVARLRIVGADIVLYHCPRTVVALVSTTDPGELLVPCFWNSCL